MWNTTNRHLQNMQNVYPIDLSVVFFNCTMRFLLDHFKVLYVPYEGDGFHIASHHLKKNCFQYLGQWEGKKCFMSKIVEPTYKTK